MALQYSNVFTYNMYKKYTPSLVEEWPVASGTQAGTLVLNASSRPGVTLTARGDSTKSWNAPGGLTIGGIKNGGVGDEPNAATVAVDGAWLFPVAGVTAGETVNGTGTAAGTKVYRKTDGTLTTTASTNVLVGEIADGRIIGTTTPVWIGRGVA